MKIIVGLGNPGKEYEKTRHNIGFQVIDLVQRELGFEEFKLKSKFEALISEGVVNEEKVILVKPVTFMNLSGQAVQKIVNFYEVEAANTIIIYDDLDFPQGDLKLRLKGGPGSHNGMISVTQCLGTENFPRLKIGIETRKPELKGKFAGKDFVLSKFSKEDEETMEKTRKKACEAIIYAIKHGITSAMNKFNEKT